VFITYGFSSTGFHGGDYEECRLSGSCMNRRFGGAYHICFQGEKNQRTRNNVSKLATVAHPFPLHPFSYSD
jgi:hypothetical protein